MVLGTTKLDASTLPRDEWAARRHTTSTARLSTYDACRGCHPLAPCRGAECCTSELSELRIGKPCGDTPSMVRRLQARGRGGRQRAKGRMPYEHCRTGFIKRSDSRQIFPPVCGLVAYRDVSSARLPAASANTP